MFPYIGGKYRQAKWIQSCLYEIDNIDVYIEPFGGAFWCYLRMDVSKDIRIIYNDINPFICNLFHCFREYETFIPKLEGRKSQVREFFEESKNYVLYQDYEDITFPDFDLGMHYLYFLTQVFSGIIHSSKEMIWLDGKYKSKYDCVIGRLKDKRFQKKLSRIEVYNKSFEDILPDFDRENVFVYIDAPYWKTEKYYEIRRFEEKHHKILAEILNECKFQWGLSYYPFDGLNEWYKDYKWYSKMFSKCSGAREGVSQSNGNEILILKNH